MNKEEVYICIYIFCLFRSLVIIGKLIDSYTKQTDSYSNSAISFYLGWRKSSLDDIGTGPDGTPD